MIQNPREALMKSTVRLQTRGKGMLRVFLHFPLLQSSSIKLWASSCQNTTIPTAGVSGTERHFFKCLSDYIVLVQIFSLVGIPQSNTEHCCHAQKIHLTCRFFRRLPNRPVINTPIVSTTVYSEGEPLHIPLERPITLDYNLLETEERTKPVCVFWNHSIT